VLFFFKYTKKYFHPSAPQLRSLDNKGMVTPKLSHFHLYGKLKTQTANSKRSLLKTNTMNTIPSWDASSQLIKKFFQLYRT